MFALNYVYIVSTLSGSDGVPKIPTLSGPAWSTLSN